MMSVGDTLTGSASYPSMPVAAVAAAANTVAASPVAAAGPTAGGGPPASGGSNPGASNAVPATPNASVANAVVPAVSAVNGGGQPSGGGSNPGAKGEGPMVIKAKDEILTSLHLIKDIRRLETYQRDFFLKVKESLNHVQTLLDHQLMDMAWSDNLIDCEESLLKASVHLNSSSPSQLNELYGLLLQDREKLNHRFQELSVKSSLSEYVVNSRSLLDIETVHVATEAILRNDKPPQPKVDKAIPVDHTFFLANFCTTSIASSMFASFVPQSSATGPGSINSNKHQFAAITGIPPPTAGAPTSVPPPKPQMMNQPPPPIMMTNRQKNLDHPGQQPQQGGGAVPPVAGVGVPPQPSGGGYYPPPGVPPPQGAQPPPPPGLLANSNNGAPLYNGDSMEKLMAAAAAAAGVGGGPTAEGQQNKPNAGLQTAAQTQQPQADVNKEKKSGYGGHELVNAINQITRTEQQQPPSSSNQNQTQNSATVAAAAPPNASGRRNKQSGGGSQHQSGGNEASSRGPPPSSGGGPRGSKNDPWGTKANNTDTGLLMTGVNNKDLDGSTGEGGDNSNNTSSDGNTGGSKSASSGGGGTSSSGPPTSFEANKPTLSFARIAGMNVPSGNNSNNANPAAPSQQQQSNANNSQQNANIAEQQRPNSNNAQTQQQQNTSAAPLHKQQVPPHHQQQPQQQQQNPIPTQQQPALKPSHPYSNPSLQTLGTGPPHNAYQAPPPPTPHHGFPGSYPHPHAAHAQQLAMMGMHAGHHGPPGPHHGMPPMLANNRQGQNDNNQPPQSVSPNNSGQHHVMAPIYNLPPTTNPRYFFDLIMGGTRLGRIIIEVEPQVAPKMAANFGMLVTGERGFGYKGCHFFQVWKDESLITGDWEYNSGRGGRAAIDEGHLFTPDETRLPCIRGAVGMRRMSKKHSSLNQVASQFRIILANMNTQFTGIFGHVIAGIDAMDKIGNIGGEGGRPEKIASIANCGIYKS